MGKYKKVLVKKQKSDNSSVCKDSEIGEDDKGQAGFKAPEVEMNDDKSSPFKQSNEISSDEDIFHETDFDDSDYILSEDAPLIQTYESSQEMVDYGSEPNDDDELPTTSKKSNKMNKNLGKEYYTSRNVKVPAKKFERLSHCKKNCHSKITLDEQKHIFKTYWNLGDYNKRRLVISQMIDIEKKKTATLIKAARPRNRQYVYIYHCEKNGQKVRVCHKCFLKIYGETVQAIKTVNIHKRKKGSGGLISDDRRGKHDPRHKLSIEKYNEVIDHINSIPKYESHYSRRHTTQLYFDRGLNLATLYRLYTEKYSDCVSESKYRDIFTTLDIRFKKPQLDLCNTCELFKSKIRNSVDEDEKISLKLEQKNHHDDADFSYECKKKDKELAINNENIKMFTFDLQQCLPTPYLRASLYFYKRSLWTFNLTVHDGAMKKASCYIWNETIANRGANDIGSCIFKCLLDLSNSVRHVVLYSDSCPGQNRNSYLCAMFHKVLEDHPSIQLIDHKFLVVGHTHLECDTVHAQIEKKRKNFFGSIQHSHDWANLISATNKNYIVHELNQEDFFDFRALLKDKYTWRSYSTSGEKFEWKKIRWMRYEKSKPGILQYKLSLHPEESFHMLDINSRRRKKPSPQLVASYDSPLAVSQNKKKDLLDMLPLISTNYHSFYQNIKAEGDIPVEIHPDLNEDEDVE